MVLCNLRNWKIHLFYLTILLVIIVILNFKNIIKLVLGIDRKGFIIINTDVGLYNPNTLESVGFLKKGIVLKYPNLDDLDDCDLGDNDRFKILIDIDGIEKKYRTYIEKTNHTAKKNVYNSLILKRAP